MMISIVNGVCKGTSFLFAKLWAPGPDEMTMWWLSARCCHFSHDFLMLFSHGSPPRNDKQMPNAFMDVILLPSHSLALTLNFFLHLLSSNPSCPPLSLQIHSYFSSFFVPTSLSFRFSLSLCLCLSLPSCRCCAWSRLQWLWSCLHSRTPPLPLPLSQSSSLPTSLWSCFLYRRCSASLLTPLGATAHTEKYTRVAVKSKVKSVGLSVFGEEVQLWI